MVDGWMEPYRTRRKFSRKIWPLSWIASWERLDGAATMKHFQDKWFEDWRLIVKGEHHNRECADAHRDQCHDAQVRLQNADAISMCRFDCDVQIRL